MLTQYINNDKTCNFIENHHVILVKKPNIMQQEMTTAQIVAELTQKEMCKNLRNELISKDNADQYQLAVQEKIDNIYTEMKRVLLKESELDYITGYMDEIKQNIIMLTAEMRRYKAYVAANS